MGGGQDKPAWTACPPGVKITRVGGKITRDSLPPGGQAVQGGKINCYTDNICFMEIQMSTGNIGFMEILMSIHNVCSMEILMSTQSILWRC